jgi:hypothetical protein
MARPVKEHPGPAPSAPTRLDLRALALRLVSQSAREDAPSGDHAAHQRRENAGSPHNPKLYTCDERCPLTRRLYLDRSCPLPQKREWEEPTCSASVPE